MSTVCRLQRSILLLLFISAGIYVNAQSLLNKTISIQADQQALSAVLAAIGRQENFYFSYNSSLIKGDSLVS